MDMKHAVSTKLKGEPVQESLSADGLQIQLKAERVQKPQSAVAEEGAAFLYQLTVHPPQPVSIALSGTSAVITLHGAGTA